MEYYIPTSQTTRKKYNLSTRPILLNNITVGLLDNTKKNADLLLNAFSKLLNEKYSHLKFNYYRKPNSSTPYPEISKIAKECDFVINAHGD